VGKVPRETIQPKKEEKVGNETLRNAILRVLERKGTMNISALKNFSGQYASKEEFQAVLDGLAASGRIMKKAGIREGSFKVWLPGAAKPQLADVAKKAAPSSDATEPSKKTPRVNRKLPAKPLPATGKTVADNKPPGNGGGRTRPAYEPIIADLMAQRQKIDNAIAALRELT
jgi:hypothetical protein